MVQAPLACGRSGAKSLSGGGAVTLSPLAPGSNPASLAGLLSYCHKQVDMCKGRGQARQDSSSYKGQSQGPTTLCWPQGDISEIRLSWVG